MVKALTKPGNRHFRRSLSLLDAIANMSDVYLSVFVELFEFRDTDNNGHHGHTFTSPSMYADLVKSLARKTITARH
jgi:hypothetical protein